MARPQVFDRKSLTIAGLSVVSRGGWLAVSVRSVADELGVSPMALYRLAPDANRLRQLIADAAAVAIQPAAGDGPILVVLDKWAGDAYQRLGQYPGLASYVITQWTELPTWLDIVELLLAIAEDDGLMGAAAVATVNAVFAYVLARAQLHNGATVAPRRELKPMRAHPERYPHIRATQSEFTIAQTDKHFRFGLDALLTGLAAPETRLTKSGGRRERQRSR